MICRTYVRHGVTNPTRKDIKTSIGKRNSEYFFIRKILVYTATINPGGWVPKKALRTVYRREYPRFLRTFTQVIDFIKFYLNRFLVRCKKRTRSQFEPLRLVRKKKQSIFFQKHLFIINKEHFIQKHFRIHRSVYFTLLTLTEHKLAQTLLFYFLYYKLILKSIPNSTSDRK